MMAEKKLKNKNKKMMKGTNHLLSNNRYSQLKIQNQNLYTPKQDKGENEENKDEIGLLKRQMMQRARMKSPRLSPVLLK